MFKTLCQSSAGSAGGLDVTGKRIDNSQRGLLFSEAQMRLTGTALDNQTATLQSAGALSIHLGSGQFTNTAGLIRSGGHAAMTAGTVLNNATRSTGLGLEALSLSISESVTIDNTEGAIRTANQLALTAGTGINNSRGLISSAHHNVALQGTHPGNHLAITNTAGTLIAGQTLDIDSLSLTGDGYLYSQGDIDIQLASTYTHTGELLANGHARLHTTGNMTNQSTMVAGQSQDCCITDRKIVSA